jgi:hypothetical protein
MTKEKPNKSLTTFVRTNEITIQVEGWVQRQKKKKEVPEE